MINPPSIFIRSACLLVVCFSICFACTPNPSHLSQDQLQAVQDEARTVREELDQLKQERANTSAQFNTKLAEINAENQQLQKEINDYKLKVKRLQEGRDALLSPPAKLQVTLLRTYQKSNAAWIEFSAVNKSDFFIWQAWIGVDVFDAGGRFLGNAFTCLSNVRPGAAATKEMYYDGVSASEIARWKPAIRSVKVTQAGGDVNDQSLAFTLEDLTK